MSESDWPCWSISAGEHVWAAEHARKRGDAELERLRREISEKHRGEP